MQIYVTREQEDWIEKESDERGISKTAIVREALEMLMEQWSYADNEVPEWVT